MTENSHMSNISNSPFYLGSILVPVLLVGCFRGSRHEFQAAAGPNPEPTWAQVLQTSSDPVQCPHYQNLKITPDARVRPWRLNAESRLWEFVLVGSGDPPSISDSGCPSVDSGTGVILVLLPGGRATLGAQSQREDGANFDPWFGPPEDKLYAKDVSPFYISAYELTAGAASRLFKERAQSGGTLSHPLTMVTWEDASAMLSEHQLRMPTEAEWEYAARGQGSHGWWSVRDLDYLGSSLEVFGNMADIAYHSGFSLIDPYDKFASDGQSGIAVPGLYQPSLFGLYDMYGNADEWCAGAYSRDAQLVSDVEAKGIAPASICRVTKGGSFQTVARQCRPTARRVWLPGGRGIDIGIRIAMSIQN